MSRVENSLIEPDLRGLSSVYSLPGENKMNILMGFANTEGDTSAAELIYRRYALGDLMFRHVNLAGDFRRPQ